MKPSANESKKLLEQTMTGRVKLRLVLSRSGACSRRKAMDAIQRGEVTVNGTTVLEPSFSVDLSRDKVCYQGREVRLKEYLYILLHKPAGYVTTTADPHAKKTVLELLPEDMRHLRPAGRLDKETEGVLLLTNDGQAAQALTHPRFKIDKRYAVTIKGRLMPEVKKRIEQGIIIDGRKTAPARVVGVKVTGQTTELVMVIHEGRKRQIRRMFQSVGMPVVTLKRISQGPLSVQGLPRGRWRLLNTDELAALRKLIRP